MAHIYVDTNIFLGFYQSGNDRLAIFQELHARAASIVLPEQTVREFRRNRAARLTNLAEQVEKSANINVYTTAIVREMPEFAEWEKARDVARIHAKNIATQLRTWARNEASDPVYQEFVKLQADARAMTTPHGALAKAQERKLLGDPPTSPDKHTVGDEIIWETLLALGNDDLIIVSRDRTFVDNESILRREYENNKSRRLLAITESLSDALKRVGQPSTPIEEAEKEQGQLEIDTQIALKTGKCPSCKVDMDEEGYEGSDGDEAWWLTCPKCRLLVFPKR